MMFDEEGRLQMVLQAGANVREEAKALRNVAKQCAEELRARRAEMEAERLRSFAIRAEIAKRRAASQR